MSAPFKSISSCFPERQPDRHHGDLATANAKTHSPHPASISTTASATASIPLAENSSRRRSFYIPLYHAAMKGNWEYAESFLRLQPEAVNARITEEMDTLLHIAANAAQTKFVEEIVRWMTSEDLELKNNIGNTALFYAASSGITRIAEVMVQKNENLPGARNDEGYTPLHFAASRGHREMVSYLYKKRSTMDLKRDDYVSLLIATINVDLFDVALKILQDEPDLATIRDPNEMTALHILARRPSAFPSNSSLTPWHRILYQLIHMEEPSQVHCIPSHLICQNENNYQASSLLKKLWHAVTFIVPGTKVVHAKKSMHMQALKLLNILSNQLSSLEYSKKCDLLTNPRHPLLDAAKFGITEVVTELMNLYPDIIWKMDEEKRSIFHISVMYRQEKIFKLIHNIGAHHKDWITSYIDEDGQNLLHLAGKLPPEHLSNVSGAALQMPRELLWFKEVEKTVHPLAKQMTDKFGRTPRMLFNEEHRALVKEEEEWMKSIASSCMLIASLMATITFAALFSVPGGNDNIKGTPIFLKSNAFTTFAMSDACALFSSLTSILVFLYILTSRYTKEYFLESLPKWLMVGLTTLFLSIVSVLVTFSATFFMVLGSQEAWIVVPVALVACIPVTLFAFLQFCILADMFHSYYGLGIFAK